MSIFSNTFKDLLRGLGVVGAGTLEPNTGTTFIPKIVKVGGVPIGNVTSTDPQQPANDAGTTNTPLTPTDTGTTPFVERVQVLERIRSSVDIDPAAKSRILQLAASHPTLTAQDLRVIFATCLYPSAQGLPSPEGYEYFLKLLEKGQDVTTALSDTRLYFKADANLTGDPGDPDAPDSQTQGRILTAALFLLAFLIIRKL